MPEKAKVFERSERYDYEHLLSKKTRKALHALRERLDRDRLLPRRKVGGRIVRMEYEATKDPAYWAKQLKAVLEVASQYDVGGMCAVVYEDRGADLGTPLAHAPVVVHGLTNLGIVTCKHLIAEIGDDDGA